MNKNNFMKAMSMIDEDLIQDADTQYTGEKTLDNAEELYSESKQEIVVSGVDVYHRTIWKKILAVAATFVIVTGAVGGGAYYFSQMKNSDNNIEDNIEYDSIYDKLKANREKYMMNTVLCVFDGAGGGYPHLGSEEQNEFFEYMDKFDPIIETESISKTARHLKFNFGTEENIYYIFDLYENGDYSWTDTSTDKTTYHSFINGKKSFDDLMKMYKLDTISSDLFNWNDVYEAEIERFILESYSSSFDPTSSLMNTAVKHKGSETGMFEFKDSEQISNIILSCDWVRADDFDFNDYYSINGMSLSEDGYLAGYYNDFFVVYKLKDIMYLDKLRLIWEECMIPMDDAFFDIDPDTLINELHQTFSNARNASWINGCTGIPQGKPHYDTKVRYYSIINSVEFIDEIASLEWIGTTEAEIEAETGERKEQGFYYSNGFYTVHEGDKTLNIYPDGYMSIRGIGCYKLKNENDTGKLQEIFEKHLQIDRFSEFAEDINKGINNYENLSAHYTYTYNINGVTDEVSGYLSVDARNEKMYMTGEGTEGGKAVTMEIVMNGCDISAAKVIEKGTGAKRFVGVYGYSNGYASPPPVNHYIYLCKDIENDLTPRLYSAQDNCTDMTMDTANDGSMNIMYHEAVVDNESKTYKDVALVLSKKGQVLSYRATYPNSSVSFVLDNYVFDSPDFTIEDVDSVFNTIKAEQDENTNNTD